MRGDGSPSDVRQLLSQRADILSTLLRSERTKGELTDTLDVSRSTVDRGVRQLESTGLVRRSGGTVTATLDIDTDATAYEASSVVLELRGHVEARRQIRLQNVSTPS